MEDIIKFGFYAVIGIIYIVSQLRKAKNKQEEERKSADVDPTPVVERKRVSINEMQKPKPTNAQPASSGYRTLRKGKYLLKDRSAEVAKVQVEYKSLDMFDALEDEDSKVKRILAERRVEEDLLRKDRIIGSDELIKSLDERKEKQKKSEFSLWFQKKSNLKQALIASEVFNRKY